MKNEIPVASFVFRCLCVCVGDQSAELWKGGLGWGGVADMRLNSSTGIQTTDTTKRGEGFSLPVCHVPMEIGGTHLRNTDVLTHIDKKKDFFFQTMPNISLV